MNGHGPAINHITLMSTTEKYVTKVWSDGEGKYCTPKWNYMIRYNAEGNIDSFWRELTIDAMGKVFINTSDGQTRRGIIHIDIDKLDDLSEIPTCLTRNQLQNGPAVADAEVEAESRESDGDYLFSEEESEHCEEEAREEEACEEERCEEEVKPKEEGMEASLTRLKIQVERLAELQTMYEGILKIQKAGQEYMEQVKRLKEENEILRNEELANIKIDEVKHFLKREEKLELQNRHLEYQLASLRREKGQENWQRRGGLKRTDGGFIPLQPAYNVWGRPGWKPPKAEVHLPTQNEAPKSEEPVEE